MAREIDFEQELIAERERGGRRERLLEGENEVLRLIVERAPLPSILTQLVRVAEQQGSAALLASILLMDDDGLHLRHGAAPSLGDTYNRAIDGIEIGPSVGSCGTAAYRRESVVVSDIANDALWANFKELALEHGLRPVGLRRCCRVAGKCSPHSRSTTGNRPVRLPRTVRSSRC